MTTKSLLPAGQANPHDFFGVVSYDAPGGLMQIISGTETNAQRKVTKAGSFINLGLNVVSNTAATASFNFRVNGAAGNQTVNVGTGVGAGWHDDLSHADSVSIGDTPAVQFNFPAGAPDTFLATYANTFSASSPAVDYTAGITTASPSAFFEPIGGGGNSSSPATESRVNMSAGSAGVLSGLQALVTSSNNASLAISLRKNGATGAQTIATGAAVASATIVQDLSHTDTIAATDQINTTWTGSAGSLTISLNVVTFAGTTSAHDVFSGDASEGGVFGTGAVFVGIGGGFQTQATESKIQIAVEYAATWSKLRCLAHGVTGAPTLVSRIGGVTKNQTITLVNGIATDLSHTDSVSAGNLLSYAYPGGAGIGAQFDIFASTLDDGSSTGSSTETSTAAMAFAGASFAGKIADQAKGAMAFSGPSFAGKIADQAKGAMAFAGVTFSARGAAAGALHFGGIGFAAFSGIEISAGGPMHFAGVGFAGASNVHGPVVGAMHFGGFAFDAGGGGLVGEFDVGVVAVPAITARLAEVDVAVVGAPGAVVPQLAELDVAVVAVPSATTSGNIEELDVAVLAYVGPCATSRCQVWKITRRDGKVYGFTSLDSDIDWLGVTYKTCKSLSMTASESASELKSVGNVEITGILDAGSISDQDLYSGLFDDAFVEVWVIPYDGQPDDQAPFRQAAGWMGKVTRGEHNFVADVIGPGARLQQAAVVEFYTPACRWDFGVLDANGIGCPVNVDALKITNIAVTGSTLRSLIDFTHAAPGGTTIWNEGTIVWQTGRNAGVACQVETVDFGSGALSLWDLAPYPPAIGDLFTLKPGCPKTKPGCDAYGVYSIGFGGFPDVPGPDALQSNADSLFT